MKSEIEPGYSFRPVKGTGLLAIAICVITLGRRMYLFIFAIMSGGSDRIINFAIAFGAILISVLVAYGGIKVVSTTIDSVGVSQKQLHFESLSMRGVLIAWSEVDNVSVTKNSVFVRVRKGIVVSISLNFYSRPRDVIEFAEINVSPSSFGG